MARNRQRAKQRKARRQAQGGQSAEPPVTTGEENGDGADAAVAKAEAKPAPAKQPEAKKQPKAQPAPKSKAAPAAPHERNRVWAFLRSSWAELRRVQWPDRQQITTLTIIVFGFVALAGAYLGLIDIVAKKVVDFLVF